MCGVRLLRPIPRALGPEDDDDAMTCRFRACKLQHQTKYSKVQDRQ